MKNILLLLFPFLSFYAYAQERSYEEYKKQQKGESVLPLSVTPVQPGINVALFKTLGHLPVRIVHDPETNTLYTCNIDGWVFKIPIVNGMAGEESSFLPPNEHQINYLQGMVYYNNTFILIGNHNYPENSNGYGVVEKCTILPNGERQWTTMLTTELYPSSGTLFDHAFAGICLSPNKDSVYITSGSRTDHGEVKNSGNYTGLREVPLTAKIFRIPINVSNIYLPNNENDLNNSGYIFARGVRNEFDIAFNAENRLFGIENSGDRDDPEEMNWLRKDKHYGFPWRIGGNDTPMQYTPYDASQDKLIPAEALARNIFYNDPDYPARPSGVTFTEPFKNLGPDANWIRNPSTGNMYQGTEVTTFTGHRSPTGLVFDIDSTLQMPYTGSGFMLAHLPDGGGGYLPNEDSAGDICQLRLEYDAPNNNYKVNTTRLVTGFTKLTDAEKVANVIYVVDFTANLWKVTLPKLVAPVTNFIAVQSDNCLHRFSFQNQSANEPMTYVWNFGDGSTSTEKNPVHQYASGGNYTVTLTSRNPQGNSVKQTNISIAEPYIISNPISGNASFKGANAIHANNLIYPGANVIYKAQKHILLNPGFKADTGSVFLSGIGGCDN
jgi:glucose/arabinose dehydrogenase